MNIIKAYLKPFCLFTYALKGLATIVLSIVIFGTYLIFTHSGTKMAFSLWNEFSPHPIQFTNLQGCLASHLEIENFHFKNASIDIHAKTLKSKWFITDLLKPKPTLQSLHAQGLMVTITADTTNLTDLHVNSTRKILPFLINHLHITDATLNWEKHSHTLQELKIDQAETILYQGTWGKLQATIQESINIDWDLILPNTHALTPLLSFFPDMDLHVNHLSGPIQSQGHIFLPTKNLNDPNNVLKATLQGQKLTIAEQMFQRFSLKVEGTLASHQATFQGIYQHKPLKATIKGQFLAQQWHGKIQQFYIQDPTWQKITPSKGELSIQWDKKQFSTSIQLLLAEQPVHMHAIIAKDKPYLLTGTIKSQIQQVKSLAGIFPLFNNVRGKLDIDLQLQGSLLQPQITGDVVLKEAKLKGFAATKTKVALSLLRLSLSGHNQLNLSGQGTWGSGSFTIQGKGQLQALKPFLEVQIIGKQLLLSDTPEYYILANPSLTLTLQNGNPQLTGKIFIPEAEIKSLKNPDMISPSSDVVILTKNKKIKKPLAEQNFVTPLATNIELILGDKIFYKGHGFTSQVKGKLHLTQAPGQIPNAQGKLILNKGKYRAYGKTFDISYGQILFTGGPIYDPIIDIHAERKIQSPLGSFQNQLVTAGMKFGGTVKSLKVEFYSSPSMPDADIISYLIVGRPQREMTHAQAELLFEAVSHLAHLLGTSRKDVQFDLAEKLKLDQFGFSKKANVLAPSHHNPLEDTVFVLGKQLSDRLYLHYSVGIVDSASCLGLRYLLGKNVTIEASTGQQGSSADILFSFEGGH